MATFLPACLALAVSLSLLNVCSSQCPISGCDGLRSFSSIATSRLSSRSTVAASSSSGPGSARGSAAPQLLWSYERHRPSGAGCVTDGTGADNTAVVCPMAEGQNVSVVSFAANGSLLWSISLHSQAVLPLVSYQGQVVLSDGQELDWLDRDGRSLAPPVHFYPVQGRLFDLTITRSTSIVTMLYRCGFISTYTVDGVPISGLWLNFTIVDTIKGTFIPLGNPVMNDTHLYVLAGFRATTAGEGSPSQEPGRDDNSTLLRLYAIKVTEALERKFTILWTNDVRIAGRIPYIHSAETYCNISSNPLEGKKQQRFSSSGNERKYEGKSDSSRSTVSWLTMEAGRLLAAVNFESPSGARMSFNMSVLDLGNTYIMTSAGYSTNQVTSISWSNSNKEYPADIPTPEKGRLRSARDDSTKFWLSSTPPLGDKIVLEQLSELGGGPVGASLILPSQLTTPVTLLQGAAEDNAADRSTSTLLVFGSSGDVSCGARNNECAPANQPQLVGVEVGGEAPSVVWSVPLPQSQPAVGQITTLPLSPHPLLFLTTPLGVYAYTLA